MQTVFEFCLEHAAELPVHRRVKLYRGLAEFCANQQESAQLIEIAENLEVADRRCRGFAFYIKNGS